MTIHYLPAAALKPGDKIVHGTKKQTVSTTGPCASRVTHIHVNGSDCWWGAHELPVAVDGDDDGPMAA